MDQTKTDNSNSRNIDIAHAETIPLVKNKRSTKERIWNYFYWATVSIGIASLIYYSIATPHYITGNPLPIFGNSKYVLSEKLSYLIWKPTKGEIIIFNQNSKSRIGIINNWSGPQDDIQYEIFSTPNQEKPWIIDKDQIIGKVYYPTRYGLDALPQSTPPLTPSSSSSPTQKHSINPQTGWWISTSPDIGFSFEYPPSWNDQKYYLQSKEEAMRIDFGSAATGFECYQNPRSITRYVYDHKIMIDYHEGIVPSENCDDNSDRRLIAAKFTINFEDYVFTLAYSKSNQAEAEELFDQILSTFKFPDCSINNALNMTINLPVKWTCYQNVDREDVGGITIKSDTLNVSIADGGRGPYCGDGPDLENLCNTRNLVLSDKFQLTVFNFMGEDKELFGGLGKTGRGTNRWISVRYSNMEEKQLTNTQKQDLLELLNSITFTD